MLDFTQEEEKDWMAADVGGAQFPDGEYKSMLRKADVVLLKKSGKKKLILEHEIVEPKDFMGKKYSQFLGLDSKGSMFFTKVELIKLGVNVDVALNQIVENIKRDAIGKEVSITLLTEGSHQRCTINEVVDDIQF